ncbi:hypothetical protein Desti_3479 [Desulfomonile tiedjei DSM 6799]|uniref:Uncharacterized protein n=1 Tax=Desulfomonile tiedjei (strain ATCC 49306 / DSM 6799 / DCB-1) TaxID=706587 RepID=I4C989_DESTA|nr:hypothetical protein Desti_3479 [Desulfomonile tiedjei DSM 6799]
MSRALRTESDLRLWTCLAVVSQRACGLLLVFIRIIKVICEWREPTSGMSLLPDGIAINLVALKRLKSKEFGLPISSLIIQPWGPVGDVRSTSSILQLKASPFFLSPSFCNLLSSIENWKITYALFAQRAIISTRYGLAALKLTEQTFFKQM